MKFENKGKWVKQISESIQRRNEVRYIDPANVDKYDKDEIEEVTLASGEKRYKRKQGGMSNQQSKQEPAKKEEPREKDRSNVSKTNIVDLPKEVSTKQLNDILQKDLNIQNREFAKEGKLTEQDLAKAKETLDNGNGIMAHLKFRDERGLNEIIGIYQKGKDGKIHRSAYQNYSGTWVRDKEDDAEYTSDSFEEFSSEVLSSLAEDDTCKLTY